MSCAQESIMEHLNNVSDMRNVITKLHKTKAEGTAESIKLLNSLHLS